jgi:competence protein ComEA
LPTRVASSACIISLTGNFCRAHFAKVILAKAKESSMSQVNKVTALRRCIQALIVTLMPALVWAGPVDINTADAATIAKELQGIGLSRAQAIVAYREKNGAFRSADDLRKIKGIGAKVLERNRANIKVEGAPRKKAE